MPKFFSLIPLIFCAMLAACGGGDKASSGGSAGGGTQTPSTTPPPSPPPGGTDSSSGGDSSSSSSQSADSVTLAWVPPSNNADGTALSDLAGFRVLYGRSADDLDHSVLIEDPNVLQCELEKLDAGTWYFAVVARAQNGIEGPPSNLAAKTVM